MSSEVIIRTATEADLPGILDIYNDAILHTTSVYDYKPHTLDMRTQWFIEQKKNDFPVFIAQLDGKIAGFASYGKFRLKAGYKYTAEHSVYIHPGFRKRGIGKLLLAKIIETAGEKGIHSLVGGVDAENLASIRLHEYFNFKVAGHLHEVAFKFGRWLDLIFLELTLDTPENPEDV